MRGESLLSARPALSALLLYILGIFTALFLPISYSIPLILLVTSLFILTLFYLKGQMRAAAWTTAFLVVLLGWFLTGLASGPFPLNHIENLAANAGQVELVGSVVDEPDIRSDKTYLVIEADSIFRNRFWIPTFGKIRAGVKNGGSRYQYSDIVLLKGYLSRPEGSRNPQGFDYGAYLRNKKIFAIISVTGPGNVAIIKEGNSFLSSVVTPLRTWLVSKTRDYLPPISAALLSGFILGEQRDIPKEYQDLFRETGTLHLMAVSGSNVALVVAIFAFPLIRLPRPVKVIILILVVVFFAILTRLQPSVVRASVMAIVGLLAYGWLRKPDYINLLALAGLVMLLWHPLQLFDVGMQLSFAATFGIIYALPKFNSWLGFLHGSWRRWIGGALMLTASTFAAQLAVLPLMAHYFQNIPVSGVLANIPMITLAGFATTLGIAFYFSSILGGWLGQLLAIPLGWLLDLVVKVLRFFASLPYANIKIASPSWPVMILIWLLLYLGFELISKRRFSKVALAAILVTTNFIIWGNALKPRSEWTLEFLDLGRNHAWIYSGPNHETSACYDCFVEQGDVDNIIIPHLINHHGGKLDYLFTITPNSSEVSELGALFGPKVIYFPVDDTSGQNSEITPLKSDVYASQSNFPASVKVVWGQSDNREGRKDSFPALRIDTGTGSVVLADWTGAGILKDVKNLNLLELPWSAYAETGCLEAIAKMKPGLAVFSPDRYSRTMPDQREKLTHSAGQTLSTSMFGGFAVSVVDGAINIETMKPIEGEVK